MNYSRKALERRMAPRSGQKIYKKLVSTSLKILLLTGLIIILAGGIYAVRIISAVIEEAPDISSGNLMPTQSASYIYNQAGERVLKLTLPEANRDIVELSSVPLDLQHAVVAIEDERFYEHKGIDPKGIVRALFRGLSRGSFSEGASTITQQLLKNTVFPGWTHESSFQESLKRKIQEQYLALKLEKKFSKEQILEDYLNLINLGAGCYGVQAASYRYFGKNVSDLNLSEATVIAGITQNPTAYNPIVYPEKNELRRKMVLDAMLNQGYISKEQYDAALADDVYARIRSKEQAVDTGSSIYSYYQDALIDQVLKDLQNEKGFSYQQAYRAVYSGGLRIYSAQDDALQAACDEAFQDPANFPQGTQAGIDYALSIQNEDDIISDYGNDDLRSYVRANIDPYFNLICDSEEEMRSYAEAFRESVVKETDKVLGERVTITMQPQASCVIIDQKNGLVKALVGGRGKKEASLTLNRASYSTRQPGSTFKILTTYAPALNECGKTLISTYVDEPYSFSNGTAVNNAGQNYQGEVTIHDAIVQSINVVAVKCLTEISPQLGFEYAKRFGISSLVESYYNGSETLTDITQTLALGGLTNGVTNLELTAAYACIANMGQYIEPKFYTEVIDQYGNIVLNNNEPRSRTVIKESTAGLLTSAMRDVIEDEKGTAYGLIDLGLMPAAGKSGTSNSYRDTWFVGYTPYYTCGIWGGYDNNDRLPDEGISHSYCKILWNSIMNRIHEDLQLTAFHTAAGTSTVSICRESLMAASSSCPEVYSELFADGSQPAYYCSVHGNGGLVTDGSISSPKDNVQSPGSIDGNMNTNPGGSDQQSGSAGAGFTIYSSDQAHIDTGSDQIHENTGSGLEGENTAPENEDSYNNGQSSVMDLIPENNQDPADDPLMDNQNLIMELIPENSRSEVSDLIPENNQSGSMDAGWQQPDYNQYNSGNQQAPDPVQEILNNIPAAMP